MVTSNNEVKAIDLLTLDTTQVVSGDESDILGSITTDPVDKRLYFGNVSDIFRSRLDGTNTEVILKKVEPSEMTIDWIRRRIFWSQQSQRKILVANLNGKDKRLLKLTQYFPRSVAVDPIVG